MSCVVLCMYADVVGCVGACFCVCVCVCSNEGERGLRFEGSSLDCVVGLQCCSCTYRFFTLPSPPLFPFPRRPP